MFKAGCSLEINWYIVLKIFILIQVNVCNMMSSFCVLKKFVVPLMQPSSFHKLQLKLFEFIGLENRVKIELVSQVLKRAESQTQDVAEGGRPYVLLSPKEARFTFFDLVVKEHHLRAGNSELPVGHLDLEKNFLFAPTAACRGFDPCSHFVFVNNIVDVNTV